MTDVLLTESDESDGGEIEYLNGLATTEDGLETAVYLSLFGGNEEDGGGQTDEPVQFWGNLIEDDESRILRSRFQNLVDGLPATTGNLARLKDAAEQDLAWLTAEGFAQSVEVTLSVPQLHRLSVTVAADVDGRRYSYTFLRNWTS